MVTKDHKLPPLQYELGDYITGIDRSYERSIYIPHSITVDKTAKKFVSHVEFELVIFDGYRGEGERNKIPYLKALEYRKATREELIESGAIPQSLDFIMED